LLLLSDSDGQARANLWAIKGELESNSLLRQDFGDLVSTERWTGTQIVTKKGLLIQSAGSGSSILGMTHGEHRPDFVIGDDLESQADMQSPSQRDKLERWWTQSVLPLGPASGMPVFMLGTIWHYDSLLSRMLANPGYQARRYKALLEWPTGWHGSLWEEWRALFNDLSNPARLDTARAFYQAHQPDMDAGAKVLWPEGDPLYSLMSTYQIDGDAAFQSQKQNEPINPADCLFRDFSWYSKDGEVGEATDRRLPEMAYTVASCDPSLGRSATKGDYSAIVVLGQGVDGFAYVLEASIDRRTPEAIIDEVIRLHSLHHPSMWSVEATAFQQFFADEMARRSQAQGVYLPMEPVHPGTDKLMRISSMQPAIRNGQILLHRSQRLLWDQLRLFPLADHDDGPDALHMAFSLLRQSPAQASAPSDLGYRSPASRSAGTSRPGSQLRPRSVPRR
jgi:predicted phage terminase large subunit-like protein